MLAALAASCDGCNGCAEHADPTKTLQCMSIALLSAGAMLMPGDAGTGTVRASKGVELDLSFFVLDHRLTIGSLTPPYSFPIDLME